jgi:hypothetical protein
MIETAVRISGEPIEEHFRVDLARDDAFAGSVQPILRHLLGTEDGSMFGDDILARIRGMQAHLACQLLAACSQGGNAEHRGLLPDLSQALLESRQILSHLHALALEWQLAERLERQYGVDPVVSPLLQALIASPDAETQGLAMNLLAAQARWCQAQRRMQLAPLELPTELFHIALLTLRAVCGEGAESGETKLRSEYVEGGSRLGLSARLVASMGSASTVALDLRHAGVMLFATALALGSRQARHRILLSTHAPRSLRLGLSLRACGLATPAIEQQLLLLYGEAHLPTSFDRLGPERAAAILADAHDARA